MSNVRARMSKNTNDGLTRSGTRCFIAVPISYRNSRRQRVNGKFSLSRMEPVRNVETSRTETSDLRLCAAGGECCTTATKRLGAAESSSVVVVAALVSGERFVEDGVTNGERSRSVALATATADVRPAAVVVSSSVHQCKPNDKPTGDR